MHIFGNPTIPGRKRAFGGFGIIGGNVGLNVGGGYNVGARFDAGGNADAGNRALVEHAAPEEEPPAPGAGAGAGACANAAATSPAVAQARREQDAAANALVAAQRANSTAQTAATQAAAALTAAQSRIVREATNTPGVFRQAAMRGNCTGALQAYANYPNITDARIFADGVVLTFTGVASGVGFERTRTVGVLSGIPNSILLRVAQNARGPLFSTGNGLLFIPWTDAAFETNSAVHVTDKCGVAILKIPGAVVRTLKTNYATIQPLITAATNAQNAATLAANTLAAAEQTAVAATLHLSQLIRDAPAACQEEARQVQIRADQAAVDKANADAAAAEAEQNRLRLKKDADDAKAERDRAAREGDQARAAAAEADRKASEAAAAAEAIKRDAALAEAARIEAERKRLEAEAAGKSKLLLYGLGVAGLGLVALLLLRKK